MTSTTDIVAMAEDGFEVYYAEKLWEMIPPIYRLEDGLAIQPDVLRSLVLILAKQAAIVRRSEDRLWDDSFIEICDAWAVPYIGELLGTRLVSASNPRGRRIDVAKTIYYRRRKGTLRVLEELITDIAGWDGKVTEQFQRLARTRHELDPQPQALAGRLTGTLPGGWADLRQPQGSELANGPFDEYAHTPDFRQLQGLNGRYNIPKLAFYIYRLTSYAVIDATPFSFGDDMQYSFDPSGRNIPLFCKGIRGTKDNYDWDAWQSAQEWELSMPIRCRLLNDSRFLFTSDVVDLLTASPGLSLAQDAELRTLIGYPILGESRLKVTLGTLASNIVFLSSPVFEAILDTAIIQDCGKRALLDTSIDVQLNNVAIDSAVIQSGSLLLWDIANVAADKNLVIDPELGRFAFINPGAADELELTAHYQYGFSGEIGAGTYDRRNVEDVEADIVVSGGNAIAFNAAPVDGCTQIDDNRTYNGLPNLNIGPDFVKNLTLQAANHCRPYIRLDEDWVLDTDANLNAFLVLDGLWIGANSDAAIVLQGDYECVVIRNCTLEPGGGLDILGNAMATVTLRIEGHVEKLLIDHSITGPILGALGSLVEEVTITDSIVQSVTKAMALDLEMAAVCAERVTVLGGAAVHTIMATEVLLTGNCIVTDTQQGCFRFSAAPIGSRVPRAFPYKLKDFAQADAWFTSRQFGDPGFAQLSAVAPLEISRGAENGAEIGAFASLNNPIKVDSLQIKVAEYMPFGLIPMFIFET